MPVFCAEFTLGGPRQQRIRGPIDAATAEAAQQWIENDLRERGLNADSEITVTVIPTFQLTWKEAGTGRRDPKVIQEVMLAMTAKDAVREFAATHRVPFDEVSVDDFPDDVCWEVVAQASKSSFATNRPPITPVGQVPVAIEKLDSLICQIEKLIGTSDLTFKEPERSRRKRGRPKGTGKYDPKKDKQYVDAWNSKNYTKKSDVDLEFKVPTGTTDAAIERHRKRPKE